MNIEDASRLKLDGEVDKMRLIAIGLCLIALLMLTACEREGPPKPVGTATNKHVEQAPATSPKEAADAITGSIKTPIEKAHKEAGDTVQKAAD
jgi:hypothetical protein